MSEYKVCVVGLGKAGIPLTCTIADAGLDVMGLDIDKKRVEDLRNKVNPIPEEPGVQDILNKCVGNNLSFSTDYSDVARRCNTYIIIVPLFIDEDKKCDFSILESAFCNVGNVLKKGDLVVLETTVPPKTTETFIKNILEKESGLSVDRDFDLAYSPERIMTGYSIGRYKEFPKVVGGVTDKSTERVFDLYKKFCKKVESVSNSRTAELIKVAEGVYRDANIAIANELIRVCDHYGVNFWEMREKANHEFCNILEGGNVGGHCIPVYPWFIINETSAPLMKQARLINDEMVDYYVQKVIDLIGTSGKVGVVGLSYREGVKEKAYTRSIPLIKKLNSKGFNVYGADPMYDEEEIKSIFGVDTISDFEEMDAIILMNKNEEYREKLLKMKEKVVDVRNTLKLK